MRFVLDASVALAWFLDRPVPDYAVRARRSLLAGARAVVPALWHLEMANGFAVAQRRGIVSRADATQALAHIEQLLAVAIDSSDNPVSMRQALATAETFQLSAYDGVYLDIARRERLPLATLDRALMTAAKRAGVELIR